MKSLLSLLFAASICLTSCKKELEPQKSSIVAPAEETTSIANPAAVTPIQPTEVVQGATTQNPAVQTQTVQNNVVAKGMNPPHGQPNHRCDIAVGAPLNSPPGKQPQAPQPSSQQGSATIQPVTPNAPAQAAAPVVTAPGMNPPHGQDGHRCDVAVGAPLPKS